MLDAGELAEFRAGAEELMDQTVTLQRAGALAYDNAGSDRPGADATVATGVKARITQRTATLNTPQVGGGLPAAVYWQVCLPWDTGAVKGDVVVKADGRKLRLETDLSGESHLIQQVFYALEVQN